MGEGGLHTVGSSNEISSSINGTVRTDVPECHVSTSQIPKSFILQDGTPDYLRLILTARVYDVVKETPITPAVGLSESLGTNIILKREDLTAVFSFKIRGAYNRIAQLPKEERWRGVIACSAGNHAQGVAFSANRLGIPATIVMPLATPTIKHVNVTRLGGKVVLYGQDFDEAKGECKRLSEKHKLTNIPPFDDPYVIAGQGTIGLEILRQIDSGTLGTVFVPVGGGGLIAGIAVYIKRIAPQVKIIGVETHDADALYQSLQRRKRVELNEAGIFADGTAVRILGEETFRLCMKYVDDVVLVSTDELCAAIKDIFSETRSIAEPSGALSVAGAKKYLSTHPELCSTELSHCAIVSGANMNFDRLRFVAERARLGEGREVAMLVKLPDHPGTFHLLHSIILPRAVTEFSYRYDKAEEMAPVFVSFTVKDREKEVAEVIQNCQENGLEAYDLSNCELAKSHVRFMIGGRPDIKHERVFRFSFPEKPGSLARFLSGLKTDWNITMFHYRNQGADVSQVLAGLFIPPQDNEALEEFIKNLDYSCVEETDNFAYKEFLCA